MRPRPFVLDGEARAALEAIVPAMLAGIATGWANAGEDEVAAFLQGWRLHRLALLRTAYSALHDLSLGAWYAQPASWRAIGYPGPLPALA